MTALQNPVVLLAIVGAPALYIAALGYLRSIDKDKGDERAWIASDRNENARQALEALKAIATGRLEDSDVLRHDRERLRQDLSRCEAELARLKGTP